MIPKITTLKFQSQVSQTRHFHSLHGFSWLDDSEFDEMYKIPSVEVVRALPEVKLQRGQWVLQGEVCHLRNIIFRGNLVYAGQGLPKGRLVGGMHEDDGFATRYPTPNIDIARALPIAKCIRGKFNIGNDTVSPNDLLLRGRFFFRGSTPVARIKEHHK